MCRVDREITRQCALETHPKSCDVVGGETSKCGGGMPSQTKRHECGVHPTMQIKSTIKCRVTSNTDAMEAGLE